MATIKDVAKLAGVSYQAVSAVLNGNLSKASPGTRERIFLAAAKLNYRPNRSARPELLSHFSTLTRHCKGKVCGFLHVQHSCVGLSHCASISRIHACTSMP